MFNFQSELDRRSAGTAGDVEPLDPFHRRQLHRLEMAPGAASANDLGFVQPDDRFRERVVLAVADAPNGWLNADLGQPLRIPDREVLHAAVAAVNQRPSRLLVVLVKCLLKPDYAKGRISGDTVVEKLGQTVCTAATIYLGARTGAAFGPLGAVVGSVVGYALAAMAYQSCRQQHNVVSRGRARLTDEIRGRDRIKDAFSVAGSWRPGR